MYEAHNIKVVVVAQVIGGRSITVVCGNVMIYLLFPNIILEILRSATATGRRLAIPDCIPHLLRPHSAKV